MKILYITPSTIRSSWHIWNSGESIASLGNIVTTVKVPCDRHDRVAPYWEGSEALFPDLSDFDTVVVSGVEFLWFSWLQNVYPQWDTSSPFKIGLYLESSTRSIFRAAHCGSAHHFNTRWYGDANDAESFDGFRSPAIIDTVVFDRDLSGFKDIDVGFAGTLYSKRSEFLRQLEPMLQCDLIVGSPMAIDVGGERPFEWTRLYVESIRRMRIHLSLPSENDFAVARPFETMACGTLLFESAPMPEDFVSGRDYVHYDNGNLPELASKLRQMLDDPAEAGRIAENGYHAARRVCDPQKGWRTILTQR